MNWGSYQARCARWVAASGVDVDIGSASQTACLKPDDKVKSNVGDTLAQKESIPRVRIGLQSWVARSVSVSRLVLVALFP
jgi:hypothetical protein